MIEEGGDWDRRNRLKVYEGAYLMTIRNFKGAADLFIATLSTFTSTELMEYKDFVTYAVLSSVLALKRVDIKNKVQKWINTLKQMVLQDSITVSERLFTRRHFLQPIV